MAATYTNPYQQYYPQLNNFIQAQQNPMIWIKGLEQAEAYPIASNSTVILWDSEVDTIYIKSSDAYGKPTMKILDYKIRENNIKMKEEKTATPDYATKQDLIDFMNKVTEQIQQLKPAPNRKMREE